MARIIKIKVVYNNYRKKSLLAFTTEEPEEPNSIIQLAVVDKLLTNLRIIVGGKRVKRVFVCHHIRRKGVAVERVMQLYENLDIVCATRICRINEALYKAEDKT